MASSSKERPGDSTGSKKGQTKRLTDAEREELEGMQGQLKNAGKTSTLKKHVLDPLSEKVNENHLTMETSKAVALSRLKNTALAEIVRSNTGVIVAPAQPSNNKSSGQDQQLQVIPIKASLLYSNNESSEAVNEQPVQAAAPVQEPGASATEKSNNANDVLASIFSTGIMVMQGIGSPLEDFIRQWDTKANTYREGVARGEIVPAAKQTTTKDFSNEVSAAGQSGVPDEQAAASGSAQGSAKKKRKVGSATAANGTSSATSKRNGANDSNIPSAFSARYPLGSLPVYAAATQNTDETDGSGKQTGVRSGQVLDHGSRYLELLIPPYHSAESMYKWYLMTYIKSADERLLGSLGTDALQRLKTREPVLVRWDDVQSYAFVEAKSEENACILGLGCFGRQLFHPTGSFTFQRWRDPDRRRYKRSPKEPKLCYADMLLFLNVRKDSDRASGKSSTGVESPFKYLIGVPGEYNMLAFRKCMDGNNEGCTRHIRHLITTQLEPGYLKNRETGETFRRFQEKSTLRCRDGSKKIAQMQPVDARSFENFDIVPMTAERMLFIFVFRDMVHRYKSSTKDTFPERLKLCRLAFVPFEDAVKMFSSPEFRTEYLPADVMHNPAYTYVPFDLHARAVKRNPNATVPILQGYLVYWVLHIRLNAALYLLHHGLESFVKSILTGGVSTGSAGVQQQQPVAPGSALPGSYQLPASAIVPSANASGYDRRVWAASPNFQDTINNEIKGIKAKLKDYILAHTKLADHLENCMATGEPYYDDAILPPVSALDASTRSSDVPKTLTEDEQKTLTRWLSIKPSSAYIGSFFPEDRGYIEYSVKTHIEYKTGPGQLAYHYFTRWCQLVESASRNASLSSVIPCLRADADGDQVIWTTSEPSKASGPEDLCPTLLFSFPYRVATNPETPKKQFTIDLQLVLGDFRGLVWWMRNSAPAEFLAALYANCGRFEKSGWNYTYHPAVKEAMLKNTWFKGSDGTPKTSYVILVALQTVIFCASTLMHALQKLHTSRLEKFGTHLAQLKKARADVIVNVIASRPSDIYEYSTPIVDATLSRHRLLQLNESMEALHETVYQLHKFINTHLPLAHAMVKYCTDEKGLGPTDAILTDPARSNMKTEAGSTKLSLYELYYPHGIHVICEDALPDCAALESYVKFISDTGSNHKEPLLEGQQKVMPVRCHTRDHDKKMDRIVFFNPAYLRYCVQNFVCSALGAYRHCDYRTTFCKALEIYAHYHDLSTVNLDQMAALLKRNKNLAINVLRENTTFHIRNNPGFYRAVRMAFDRYTDFEDGWLKRCMDNFRMMLDRGADIGVIDARLREQFGKNTPFVYRRIKTDFFKFFWNRLKEVSCKRLVQEFMKMDRFEWPDILSMTKESLQYMIHVVKELDPDDPDFDYADTLAKLGCSEETIAMVKTIESAFHAASEITSIESLLETLREEEHLIVFAFFHLLRARSSIKILSLPREELEKQRIAIARRAGIDPSLPLPVTSTLIAFCSIAGCNKRKTPVVQERGVKYFGTSDVSWDLTRGVPVCKPKKPPKSASAASAASSSSSKKKKPKNGKKKRSAKNQDPDADAQDEEEEDGDDDHEDEDENDHDHTSPSAYDDEDDNEAEFENVKSLVATVREFDEKLRQIREKEKKVRENVTVKDDEVLIEGRSAAAVYADIQKLNEWALKLEVLRDNVYKAAKRDANRFVRRLFDIPCDETALEVYPACGQVIERSFIKEKVDKESYTRCPSCGCPTVFRTDMWYANGFTCGICDAKLREDLHKPCCLCCNRLYLNKEPEKKKKRTKGTLHEKIVVTNEEEARFKKDKKISMELYSKYKIARDFISETMKKHEKEEDFPEAVQAPLKTAMRTVYEVENLVGVYKTGTYTPDVALKIVTAAADKRGSKRRKLETTAKPVAQAASSVEEDRTVRQKRTNRSTTKLGTDDWFRYELMDLNTANRETVFVCSICGLDRSNWLRELEPYCTVQEFIYVLRSRISSAEEAKRSLNIGHHANTSAALDPDRMNSLNKLLASVGVLPIIPKGTSTYGTESDAKKASGPTSSGTAKAHAKVKKMMRTANGSKKS